jgi:acyl-coenzyme A thioesterase PaaI-like protein
MTLELPHTAGCLVCGRDNAHGLKLSLYVDQSTGAVNVSFVPRQEHIGFNGIIHGGLIATVVDEAMVWAATWEWRRFCVCGEMLIRFRSTPSVGQTLTVQANATSSRPKLVVTAAEVRGQSGLIATAEGKYVPLPSERNEAMMATLLDEPPTRAAAAMLRAGDVGALGAQD